MAYRAVGSVAPMPTTRQPIAVLPTQTTRFMRKALACTQPTDTFCEVATANETAAVVTAHEAREAATSRSVVGPIPAPSAIPSTAEYVSQAAAVPTAATATLKRTFTGGRRRQRLAAATPAGAARTIHAGGSTVSPTTTTTSDQLKDQRS